MKGIGLYGKGMHDFVLRECEVGYRVAAAEDDEACGFGPLLDYSFNLYCQERKEAGDPEYQDYQGVQSTSL